MKIKIEDKETIKNVKKELKNVYRKYNAYPFMEIDLATNTGQYVLYELDKLTAEEKKGIYN